MSAVTRVKLLAEQQRPQPAPIAPHDRPHPPDPRASRACRPSGARRRQVRRFRIQPRARRQGVKRLFLHARRLAFKHPVDGKRDETGVAAAGGHACAFAVRISATLNSSELFADRLRLGRHAVRFGGGDHRLHPAGGARHGAAGARPRAPRATSSAWGCTIRCAMRCRRCREAHYAEFLALYRRLFPRARGHAEPVSRACRSCSRS